MRKLTPVFQKVVVIRPQIIRQNVEQNNDLDLFWLVLPLILYYN